MFIRPLVLAAAFTATLLHPPYAAAQAAAPPVAEPGLRVGDTVPAFHAAGFDGAIKSIDYPKGTTTLVVFFLSGCPTCHKMLPVFRSPGKEVLDAFKLKRVPYTVRVAPGGRVEGADLGLLDGIRMGELFRP